MSDDLFNPNMSAGTILKIDLSPEISLAMIWCSPGSFKIGSPDGPYLNSSEPLLDITLTSGFWIASTPITRRQAEAVSPKPLGLKHLYEISLDSPASQPTWMEAKFFCEELTHHVKTAANSFLLGSNSYRFDLPSQAQWEYACRAGTDTKWYFGDNERDLVDYAWYNEPSGLLPAVGLKQCNLWGLYDVYGMVYEWCLDHEMPYSRWANTTDPVIDDNSLEMQASIKSNILKLPSGDRYSIRVVRGGCIYDRAGSCTSASRYSMADFNSQNDLTGLRPVLVAKAG